MDLRNPTQEGLVRRVVYQVALTKDNNTADVTNILTEALDLDERQHAGQVFGQGRTPRASARRALYQALEHDTLLIKDGHGIVRIRVDALHDLIIQGDAWQVLDLIPDGCISTIIADPPWTHLAKHRAVGTTTRMTSNNYFEERDADGDLIQEFHRVLKPGGYLCMYVPPFQDTTVDIWLDVMAAAKQAGFTAIREVTWKKQRSMGYRWTGTTEPVLCYAKPLRGGKLPPCEDKAATNHVEANAPRAGNRTPYTDYTAEDQERLDQLLAQYGKPKQIPRDIREGLKGQYHDTEKPIEVAEHLLRVAGDPGGILVEIFAGTGHAAPAAKAIGMRYVAIEGNPRTAEHCLAPRLQRLGMAPTILEVRA